MKLREIENYGLKILNEKAKDGSMTVYAKFSEAEKRNQNSRIYPREIMTREVDRLQSKINAGQFLGSQDHSDSPATFLKDVSHVVTKLEMVGNDGFATIKILNTNAGRNVQEIIRGSGKVGISTRSVGTVSAKGIVQKDLRLLALDLVASPSVADATIGKENILEGLNFEEEANENLEKEIQELEKESYLGACESGYKGTQEEWEAKYSGSLREMMGLPQKENGKVSVQELTEQQVSKRTFSYYQEAVQSGYKEDFNTWKTAYPRLVEMAGEVKVVVEKKVENKVPFKSKTTIEEIRLSGFRGTVSEFEEKFPNITVTKLAVEKPIVETLDQESKRIFYELKKDNPNSALQLEDVEKMLEKEAKPKREKKTRELAIFRVNASLAGSGSVPPSAILEKMIIKEVEAIEEERAEKKRKNWQAYKRLLSD